MRTPNSMPSRGRRLAGLLLAAGLAGACGAADPIVKIDSVPEGATVYIDGERAGEAGDKFALHYGGDQRRKIFIQLCKHGYQPVEVLWELAEVPSTNAHKERQRTFTMEKLR